MDDFREFHAILRAAGIRYLLGVIPRPADNPLDSEGTGSRPWTPEEAAVLSEIAADVEVALHGWTHRARPGNVRAEIIGYPSGELERTLVNGLAVLRDAGLAAQTYIPPFNAVDHSALAVLRRWFDLVCGGPESVRWLGCLPGPCRLEGVWFLPSYPPAYGRATDAVRFVRAVRGRALPLVIPITLHWAWEEADRFEGVRQLAEEVAGLTVSASAWLQGRAWA